MAQKFVSHKQGVIFEEPEKRTKRNNLIRDKSVEHIFLWLNFEHPPVGFPSRNMVFKVIFSSD